MKFKISDISRLTGFSASGIRFYEKAGVISPLRGVNGKYRDFFLHELQLLLMCKHYRDSGFTLQESVDLLNHANVHQVNTNLLKQCNRLSQEIKAKELLLEFIRNRSSDIEKYQAKTLCCQVVKMPALLRIKVWQPGRSADDHVPFSQVYEWLGYMPFSDSSVVLTEDALLHGSGELETDWGIAIEEQYATRMNLSSGNGVEYIPAKDCLRLVVPVSENLTIMSRDLRLAREYLSSQSLQTAGPAVSHLLFQTNLKGVLSRFDLVWVPVRPLG